MTYTINHIHLKARDPADAAAWYAKAFDFKIIPPGPKIREGETYGDCFVRCETTDGVRVNISNARHGEVLGEGASGIHWGLEHFAIDIDDLDAEIEKLVDMGARVLEGPVKAPSGNYIAFIEAPDQVRIELMQAPSVK